MWQQLEELAVAIAHLSWGVLCVGALFTGWGNAESFEDFFLTTMFVPMIYLLGVGVAQRGI